MNKPAVTFTLIQAEKRSRFNPIKDLTAEKLSSYLDEFRSGQLANMARTMDAIEERDDVLICVVPKAKAAVARHGFEVMVVDTETPEQEALAQRQKKTLEAFYNNVTATDAIDPDEIGGFSLLVRQMMDAKGKRYSIHNIVWRPIPDGYTATFHHVPLWFFENMEGRMRFIDQPFGYYGSEMEPGAWLVTKGEGLMIACSVAYMFKRLPLQDWLIYSSRHGMPGFEGVTDAVRDSDEWKLLEEAVAAAASEFAWVRNRTSEINKIDFSAEGQLPYPPLIERMDRALAAIWRGGDLATMSKDGKAVGSNPQEKESTLVEEDDAAWISEVLNYKVDRLVLDYTYGPGTPALAYVKVLTARKQNVELDLKIDDFAVRNGHPISQEQFAERYNRPLPDKKDLILVPRQTTPTLQSMFGMNEADPRAALMAAAAEDLQPIRERIAAILQIDDPGIQRQKAIAFLDELPGLLKDILKDSNAARVIQENLQNNLLAGLKAGQQQRRQ